MLQGTNAGTVMQMFSISRARSSFVRHIPNLRRILKGEEVRMNYLWKGVQEIERVGGLNLAPLELRIKRGLA